MRLVIGGFSPKGVMRFVKKKIYYKIGQYKNKNSNNSNKMFKSKSYNVKKVSKKNEKEKEKEKEEKPSSTMTLKKKDKIKSLNNKESPDYHKKAYPKNVPTKNWVENKTYNKTDKSK